VPVLKVLMVLKVLKVLMVPGCWDAAP